VTIQLLMSENSLSDKPFMVWIVAMT